MSPSLSERNPHVDGRGSLTFFLDHERVYVHLHDLGEVAYELAKPEDALSRGGDVGRFLAPQALEYTVCLYLLHHGGRFGVAYRGYSERYVAKGLHVNTAQPEHKKRPDFSDRVMRGVIERDGVIGTVPLNSFLKSGWSVKQGSRRDDVPLDTMVAHLDHLCQLAGDSLHAGIGSDFDGGFGVQSVPPEIDTVADLQKIGPLLRARGYSDSDVENILGMNWIRFLEKNLPS